MRYETSSIWMGTARTSHTDAETEREAAFKASRGVYRNAVLMSVERGNGFSVYNFRGGSSSFCVHVKPLEVKP